MVTPVQNDILKWLANGHTGISSKTMAFWLGFGIRMDGQRPPQDPADFNRCLGLLAAAPALRDSLYRLSELSADWGRLVPRWDEVEATFRAEVGPDWSNNRSVRATKTYHLMKEILDEVPAAADA